MWKVPTEGYFIPLQGATHVVAGNLVKLHATGNAGVHGVIGEEKTHSDSIFNNRVHCHIRDILDETGS
jgi:hypothetical protein